MDPEENDIQDSSIENISQPVDERIGIIIKIIALEKMEPPTKIIIKIELNGKTVGKSEEMTIESTEEEINWETFFEIPEFTESVIDELIAHPLVFTIFGEKIPLFEEEETPQPKKGSKGAKSKKAKLSPVGTAKETPSKSASKAPSKSASKSVSVAGTSKKTSKSVVSNKSISLYHDEPYPLLGITSMDIMPALLAKDEVGEVLSIHPMVEQKGTQAVSWPNLPTLEVSVSLKRDETVDETVDKVSNVILFALESVINVTPDFTEEMEAATILPQDQIVKFKNAARLMDDSVWMPQRFKWHSMSHLNSQGALSPYSMPEDIYGVFNTMDNYNMMGKNMQNLPRIRWHQLYRTPLSQEGELKFKNKLIKYNCWPFEFVLSAAPSKKTKTEGKKKNEKDESDDKEQTNHFITFLDLSRLIYPGERSTRVASQLYTYTEGAMAARFGSSHNIFEEAEAGKVGETKPGTPASKKTPESPKSGKKSVGSKKGSKAQSKKESTSSKKGKKEKVKKIEEVIEEEPVIPPEPQPVFNEEGEPLFVIVHVELLKPLTNQQDPEEVLESIKELIPERPQPTPHQEACASIMNKYKSCIKNLTYEIEDEYQMFHNKNDSFDKSCKKFLMHLHKTGAFQRFVESIKESVGSYVEEVVGQEGKWDGKEFEGQELVSDIYYELVNSMREIITSIPSSNVSKYDPDIPCDTLQYFSNEYIEENDYNSAEDFLLQKIDKTERADPAMWTDYAVLLKRKLEFGKAEECAREAVSLDPRYPDALLFHGLLSWLLEDLRVAEMFLLALVTFSPFSLEGWVSLHLIHRHMNKVRESNVELSVAKSCVDNGMVIEDKQNPKLSRSGEVTDIARVYIIAATKMLDLGFFELAEVALSYDLLIYGKTENYLYYVAVCHYHQGRYEDSIKHLEEALKIVWEDAKLWVLKGHNFYKLQKMDEAKEAFHVAINFNSEGHEDMHMINLRMGNIFLSEGDHESAYKFFLSNCKNSPTPLSWLGIGIAAFMGDDLENAEMALCEANMLDCKNARVWGYLALVNLLMSKQKMYNRCLLQAFKYGLDDPVLIERIQTLRGLIDPSDSLE